MTVYAGETVGFPLTVEDESGKPVTPLPPTVTVEVWDKGEATLLQAALAMTLLQEDNGVATGGTSKTLIDTGQAWTPGQYRDYAVRITAGTGQGTERRIRDNTATTLTVDDKQIVAGQPIGVMTPAPDSTSVYQIHRARYALNWDSPSAPDGQDVVAVFRAAKTGGVFPFRAAEKVFFRLEAHKV